MNLRPADFWTLTLAEWRFLVAATAADAPSGADLAALLALYPDDRP